ncbi:hypothetical protein [Candidatus Thiosymbion oneisti]|uniref:hypothetical protein n=1 Tax=Candidatus Thiosymbion oneisti TaxID=589554 RepID=UPI000B7EE747|nr:hypothetical protein [Candidatus Thiosymbion oneisti]
MTTKELIKAEIDNVDDRYLDELYSIIKNFVGAKSVSQEGSFMSRLKCIKINAPLIRIAQEIMKPIFVDTSALIAIGYGNFRNIYY